LFLGKKERRERERRGRGREGTTQIALHEGSIYKIKPNSKSKVNL
jgi:hypothetical protein